MPVKFEITAENDGFIKALEASKKALIDSVEQMKAITEGLSGAFEKVQKAVLGITTVLAGGAAFKDALESTVSWAEGAITLSRALGITTERASVYQAALQHLGISNETLIGASDRVSKQIHKNAEAFELLGIATKNSNGSFRPAVDIISDATTKLAAMPNVVSRNIAAQTLFGKSLDDARQLMRLTADEMDHAQERAEALGLIVGPQGAAQAHAYKEGLADAKLVVTALETELGNQLIPVLINVGRIFSESGSKDVGVFSTLLKGVAYIAGTVSIEFEKMGLWIGKLAAQAGALVHGDFGAIGAIQKDFNDDLTRLNKNADELWDKLNRPVPKQVSPEIDTNQTAPTDDPNAGKSRVSTWQTELEEKKAAFQEEAAAEGQLLEFSKQQEIAYWQQVLATTKTSLEERKEIRAKIAADELGIDKARLEGSLATIKNEEAAAGGDLQARLAAEQRYADQVGQVYGTESKEYAEAQKTIITTQQSINKERLELEEIYAATLKQQTLAQIATEESVAQQRFDLGQITEKELLTMQKQFADEKFAIAQAELEREIALAQANGTLKDQALLNQQLLQLQTQHDQQILNLDNQMVKQEGALWKTLSNTIQENMSRAFVGVIERTETVHQAFRKMLTGILGSVIETVAKMIAKWVEQAAVALLLNRQQALSHAGVAASGAMASAAAIPYIGWILAPIEGAAVYAAALGYGAEGGFDIPAGLNPATQLHQKEMVLPAKIADPIREAVAPGGRGLGGGGNMNFNITAMNARSIQKALKRGGALQKAIRDIHRRGGR